MTPVRDNLDYAPDYAVPPGETLLEKIQELGMSQTQLAMRLDLSEKHVSQIVNGQQPISQQTAIGLERVTGIPAQFWNRREAIYQERLARIQDVRRLSKELEALKQVPVGELIRRGLLREKKDRPVQLQEVLSFFGVSNTDAMFALWESEKAAARKSKAFASHPGCTATWLRLGEMTAAKLPCREYDRAHFFSAVQSIRSLTVQSPGKFVPEMTRLCAEAGVAFVLVPEIGQVRWYGASKWLTPRKGLIQLSLRGKKDDQFWFSFFHEAGHILTHGKKEMYINEGSDDDPLERQADDFARKLLIPTHRVADVLKARCEADIIHLAASLGISPGIVAGRYQHETRRYNRFNRLKRTFQWDLSDRPGR